MTSLEVATPPAPSRSKPRLFEVVVREVIRETADTTTLVFDVPEQMPTYRAGQFLTVDPRQFPLLTPHLTYLEELKGRKELVRAYSMASAPHEPLAITIKEEPYISEVSLHRALLSPLLVHGTPVGARMQVLGFTGPYNLPPDIEERTDHLLHIVAGSGAVPNWSMLKFALREHPRLRHTFVYSNKVWEDVIYRDALNALAVAHPDRLKVVHTLTRESELSGLPVGVRTGRISLELLAEVMGNEKTTIAYVCGPAITPWDRRAALEARSTAKPRFLESTLGLLKALGFTRERIRHEAFG